MFCGKCGSQLVEGVCPTCTAEKKNEIVKKNKNKIGIIAGVVAIGLAGAGYLVYQNSEVEIVRYYGMSEHGTRVYDGDFKRLASIGKKMQPITKLASMPSLDQVEYSVSSSVPEFKMTGTELLKTDNGLVNYAGKTVLDEKITVSNKFGDNYSVYYYDYDSDSEETTSRTGVVNPLGEWVEELTDLGEDESVAYLADGKHKIVRESDDNVGVKDSDNNWVIEPEYASVSEIQEGLFYVVEPADGDDRNKQGLLTLSNEWVKEPTDQFYINGITKMKGEKFLVFNDGGSSDSIGVMNLSGQVVIQPEYRWIETLSEKEGYFKVTDDDGECGVLSATGDTVIEPTYTNIKSVSDGKFVVTKKEKDGLMTANGDWIIEPSFRSLRRFNKGLAPAKKASGDKFGIINESGEWVVKPAYENLYGIKDGLAIIQDEDDKSTVLNIKENKKLFDYKDIYINKIMGDNLLFGRKETSDNYETFIKDFSGKTKASGKEGLYKITWTVTRKEAKNF